MIENRDFNKSLSQLQKGQLSIRVQNIKTVNGLRRWLNTSNRSNF